MASEIEVVTDGQEKKQNDLTAVNGFEDEERLKNDVYTAAAYGDLVKLSRLVEFEGCSVSLPDAGGYYALQWAALNNRSAAAQFLIEVEFGRSRDRFTWPYAE